MLAAVDMPKWIFSISHHLFSNRTTTKYISKASNSRQTKPMWNQLGHSDNKVAICCYQIEIGSICLCSSKYSVLFAAKLDFLQSICHVTKMCTDAWRIWQISIRAVMHAGITNQRFPLKSLVGKTFPASPDTQFDVSGKKSMAGTYHHVDSLTSYQGSIVSILGANISRVITRLSNIVWISSAAGLWFCRYVTIDIGTRHTCVCTGISSCASFSWKKQAFVGLLIKTVVRARRALGAVSSTILSVTFTKFMTNGTLNPADAPKYLDTLIVG